MNTAEMMGSSDERIAKAYRQGMRDMKATLVYGRAFGHGYDYCLWLVGTYGYRHAKEMRLDVIREGLEAKP